ncbi:16S rRNA (guanine(527)-N(7))-methyltransferase RsmG [Pusillimonas sp. NJUB218]|uniref:16S rRNA (guanine(527)-N(7))-methyltransferase RsmG n=1 Tax=Pusillimonas sp. NJUB218 TaxID=2023230 RepID=UPI000F4B8F29|nr:16S rRNA (guanine(527)-N(7))-methyltransferase RsmG [Pusillimonas sp. NJUB218]ROT43852.1 16S rRNA (guanine(527)-N(7))-methyltransferase RsmG [Pusillimonas sp. NJUB218]
MKSNNRTTSVTEGEQLQKWNRTYNLTAIREPEQMLVQHVFDSLAIIPALKKYLDTISPGSETRPIVDVGSGAGLPGVVIAILLPERQVHCIDAVEKKMAFVRQISGVLKLTNLHAHHARVESLPAFNAQVVVSRAFASLNDFAKWSGQHVAASGVLLAMKGREPREEINALHEQTEWRVSAIEPLHVPALDAQRCLVWMSRKENK